MIQFLKKYWIIIAIIVLLLSISGIYIYRRKNAISADTPLTDVPPAPADHSGVDIAYTVASLVNKQINYTISADSESVSGVAKTTAVFETGQPLFPLASILNRRLGQHYYSIVPDRVNNKITMTVSHVETTPNIHYVVDKTVVAQF